MNNLYEALEVCLREIEQGADVDTVLFRYPDLADELRPILETSVNAKAMAVPPPSQEVVRRNRAKVLQHAAELREAKAGTGSRRIWSVPLRRAFVTLMVVVTLFVSGTGLVRAASSTLPGDNLYPVKRTWEDVSLLFTFDDNEREALEFEHENERLEELRELFAKGRSAEVDFSGYVTRQNGNEWRVSGITVLISEETRLPDGQVANGAAVRVRGQTLGDGVVHVERIELLSSNIKLPEVDDPEIEIEQENNENSNQQGGENSGEGSETETPEIATPEPEATETPEPEFRPVTVSFEGLVSSINGSTVVVDGISMDISEAEEVKGTPAVGITAKGDGYYDAQSNFVVVKIEFKNESLNNNDGNGSNSNENENENENENRNENNNENENSGKNKNNNENENSGSSGGGNDNDDD